MKIKKSILTSIINAVIREQDETNEEADLEQAYRAIAQATMSREWGKNITLIMNKIVIGVFLKVVPNESLSFLEIKENSERVMKNDRVLAAIKKESNNALEKSSIYQESSESTRKVAKDSLHRIMEVALNSMIAEELIFVVLYKLSNVDVLAARNMFDIYYEELDPSWEHRVFPIENPDRVLSLLRNVDILDGCRTAWNMIMKFVGLTDKYENKHFDGIVDAVGTESFGMPDDGWGFNPYAFGLEVQAPF